MKENNLQKKPSSAREYANLFLLDENGKKRDFSNVKNVCLITIGCAETSWILLQEFAGKNITIIDRKSEIDYIETLIKIHKLNDIRIIRKEVETDEVVLSAILDLNMNMFDLIIANPPYGKASSLSKKIVNTLLENKVAEEYVVLAPPKTFYDSMNYVLSRTEIKQGGDYFEGLEASDIRVCTCLLSLSRTGPYKSLADFLLTEKQYRYYKAVADYRKGREDFFTSPGWITIKLKPFLDSHKKEIQEKGILFGIWSPSIFANGIIRFGEDWKYNKGLEDITLHNSSSAPWLLMLKGSKEKENFLDWLYKGVTEDSKNIRGSLRYFAFNVLVSLYGGGVSPVKYLEILPNLDWSHLWTDQEILKELGLPEDFLEE